MTLPIIATPLIAAALGIGLGYALARWLRPWLGWALAALALGAALVLIFQAQSAQGMEGMGLFVLSALMLAPAGLGAALGTVLAALGALRRKGPGA